MLAGREPECARLEALLDGARVGESGALVVRGEPGIGKSALLRHARGQATDMLVLETTGIESESDIAFAGLYGLLRPVIELREQLPDVQARALEGALGMSATAVPDRFLVAIGVLGVLAAAAEDRPLLCVIDDAQWLDTPSGDALLFAARRIRGERIVMVFAARQGEAAAFAATGLPDIVLAGLDGDSASALLHERVGEPPDAALVRRLIAETGGNPLALTELSVSLTGDELTGRAAVPDAIPLTTRLQTVFADRVRRLPPDTRRALLLAAAEPTGDTSLFLQAGAALGLTSAALEPAETAQLVATVSGRIEFRHPLVRSAIYQGATLHERRQAHRALADRLDGSDQADRRTWHLAAATPGADEQVAAELAQVGERARTRGGWVSAAAAFERAAEVSADPALRARRLLTAAQAAWRGGRGDRARALLERIDVAELGAGETSDVAHVQGMVELATGTPGAAYAILSDARTMDTADIGRTLRRLADAGNAASIGGDIVKLVELGERARSLAAPAAPEERFLADTIIGNGAMIAGDAAEGARRIADALRVAEGFEDPALLTGAGIAAVYTGDLARGHDVLAQSVGEAARLGMVDALLIGLSGLVFIEVMVGRLAQAQGHIEEGLKLALDAGADVSTMMFHTRLAMIHALRGEEEACRSAASAATSDARGLGLIVAGAAWSLGRLELGLGRPAEAFDVLLPLAAPVPGTGHPLVTRWAMADIVEAGVRSGRLAEVQTVFDGYAARAGQHAAGWALAQLELCRGLLGAGDEAGGHLQAALALYRQEPQVYDRGRCALALGEHLRRERRRVDARPPLREAIGVFDQLGATPWAERARTELRASGETSRRRDPATLDQLTPQELQISQLVAEGMSNRDIAARLFLSPRTVEYHLAKVFPKLGIASRSELAALGARDRELVPG